jgi:pimeloyl-ACP methyl ester carboxylesterase
MGAFFLEFLFRKAAAMLARQEGFVEVEQGVRLYFQEAGDGPAVLIPLVGWTEEFEAIADGRRIIRYDPRNRGNSTAVALENVSFQNDVRDIESLRVHFALDSFTLIGWSHYAGVVIRYAMEYPERLDRVVMVCGPPISKNPHTGTMNRVMMERISAVAPDFLKELQTGSAPTPAQMKKFWDLILQVRAGKKPALPPQGNPSQFANETPGSVSGVIRRGMETMGDWNWTADAARVKCPVLFAYGTEDFLPAEAAEEWIRSLPNCRALKMEGVGHFPSLEAPEKFFRDLAVFLRAS